MSTPRDMWLPESCALGEDGCRRWYENVSREIPLLELPDRLKDKLRDYYSEVGLLRSARRPFFHHHYARLLAAAVQALFAERPSPPRILELGCGTGTQALLFALLGANVVALDLDADALQVLQARRAFYESVCGRSLRVAAHCANAFEFPFASHGPFDGVYSLFAFNMMQPSRGLIAAIEPSLEDGAALAIQDGNCDMWYNRLFRKRNVLSPSSLRRLLERNGWTEVCSIGGFALPPPVWLAVPRRAACALDAALTEVNCLTVTHLHLARFRTAVACGRTCGRASGRT